MSVGRLLLDPDKFFEQRADSPGLFLPIVIVITAGLTNAASFLVITPRLLATLSAGSQPLVGLALLVGALASFLAIVVVWFFYAVAFQFISGRFGGDGEFRTLFLLVGWGFLPAILSGAFSFATTVYVFNGVAFPTDPTQYQPFLARHRSRFPFVVSRTVTIVFTLWQGFLWTFAVHHVKNIDLRRAAISVGVPIWLTVAWRLYNLV